ncbi:hypothetical protein B0H17DRAFT_1218145 [Mycena rosella]|uniref:Uncharacterized protein n=1 Tax=Mycena rosella TaxID=1033263 RepID=A0AAD7BT09_MYCRO|nr:hypothetical protein B0H17DRAFT_1218145 [Mycena rosella]
MDNNRREDEREMSAPGAPQAKTSPSPPGGKEFPFPPFPAANSSTLNEAFSGHLENRTGEPKRRSRSQSRSASSLLLVATERLGQETNRANALDLRCAEVLAHLRTIVEDREQLRRNLAKVTEELSLYKLQLDVAQNEIFRAQKIVDGVDKARVEAEEQAAKDRTIARQLVSERAVWIAREEGRNEGFQEGLRQGRRQAYETARRRADEYADEGYDEGEEAPETYEPSVRRSPPSNRRGWSSPSRSVRSTLPDAASYISTQPARSRTPSPPSNNVPSTQSHEPTTETYQSTTQSDQPTTQPAAQPRQPATPRPPRARSPGQSPGQSPSPRPSRPLPRAPARSPEPIDIRPDRSASRARTPSVSHPPVTLPPDGWIPTVGADSVIILPPPHELSRPVSFVEEDTLTRTPGAGYNTPSGGRRRTMSNVSRGSTRISEYGILSPPRRAETPVTRSNQVAHAWRAANTDTVDPPGRERRQEAAQDGSENLSTRSSTQRSQVSRRSGPRRPREIVMPMPLSTSMHAAGMSHAPPAPQLQPHTAPAGPSHAASGAAAYVSMDASSYAPTATSYFAPYHPEQQPQDYGDDTDPAPARPRSALSWIKTRFNRSFSASTVNIHIEPPSNPASNSSTGNTVNAVLLTPDDAGQRTLPQHFVPELAGALDAHHYAPSAEGAGSVIVLPDNELPRGFMPLSPIMPSLYTITPFPLDASAPPPPRTSCLQPARHLRAPAAAAPALDGRGHEEPPGNTSGHDSGRARGASIGSAMLQTSPAPLNRPLSIFSEA